MTEQQADELASYVANDRGRSAAVVRTIGNGEHVVVMKARTYYLWCFEDYLAYNQEEEATHAKKREQQLVAV